MARIDSSWHTLERANLEGRISECRELAESTSGERVVTLIGSFCAIGGLMSGVFTGGIGLIISAIGLVVLGVEISLRKSKKENLRERIRQYERNIQHIDKELSVYEAKSVSPVMPIDSASQEEEEPNSKTRIYEGLLTEDENGNEDNQQIKGERLRE